MQNDNTLPLGKQVSYQTQYDPTLLCPIPRKIGRDATQLQIDPSALFGVDIWNIYELSWLSPTGKPVVAMAEVRVPMHSPNLIESKSLKLYCNSFNMSSFENSAKVCETMVQDLSKAAGEEVTVLLLEADQFDTATLIEPDSICLDNLEPEKFSNTVDPTTLTTKDKPTEQNLFSRLFRSCCPVTGQPDWATVHIHYIGKEIDQTGLLQYLVSYREHTGFHEACVEKIFDDIMCNCKPDKLQVLARFTRRGGIDINPVRSTHLQHWKNRRDPRQ